MNTLKFCISMLLAAFALYSCENGGYQMLTKINRDGTCSREFTEKADSAFLLGDTAKSNPFPFIPDTSWKIRWQYDSAQWRADWPLEEWKDEIEGEKITVKARKKFPSVQSMAEYDYLEKGPWRRFFTDVEYKKKFRWFYTYYSFKETFPNIEATDHFMQEPVTNYLTQKELKLWTQGGSNCFEGMNGVEISQYLSDIENKYNKWFSKNNYELLYSAIVNNMHYEEYPGIDKKAMKEARDTIYTLYKKKEKDMVLPEVRNIIPSLNAYFNTGVFNKLKQNEAIEREAEKALAYIEYFGTDLAYNLLMPGSVVTSNAKSIRGDTLHWRVDAYRFSLYDFAIRAKSREANTWAFVVTGILIVLVILSFVLPKFIKRQSP